MPRLLLFHDFASPFCRVAIAGARAAVEGTAAFLELVPFELYPDDAALPTPGAALAAEVDAALPLARACGVELIAPPLLPRTRKAHEAVLHARQHNLAAAMASAIYDALWGRGVDIGRIDLLADIGADVGLERDALHVALGLDVYHSDVARGQRLVLEAGVDSVPTFQVGRERITGLMPLEELREWIEAVGE